MTIIEIPVKRMIPVLEGIPEPVELDDESAGGVWDPVICLPPYGPGMLLGECHNELVIEVPDIDAGEIRVYLEDETLFVESNFKHNNQEEPIRSVVLPYSVDVEKAFAFINIDTLQIRLPKLRPAPTRED